MSLFNINFIGIYQLYHDHPPVLGRAQLVFQMAPGHGRAARQPSQEEAGHGVGQMDLRRLEFSLAPPPTFKRRKGGRYPLVN